MNIVFLTLGYPSDINARNLYTDLMASLVRLGHSVSVLVQDEIGDRKEVVSNEGVTVIPIYTGKVTKTSLLKKGINIILLEKRFYKALRKRCPKTIDVLLYSTPPITFCGVIKKVKKSFNCTTYLLLKDIFPQNAVDLGMFSKNSPFYYYFRRKEKLLYKYSDLIGCMSPANVRYVLEHNKGLGAKVHISPNCIIPSSKKSSYSEHSGLKLIYGGNLGKPQGIPYIIDCCKIIEKCDNVEFTIIGSGTEFSKIEDALNVLKLQKTKLISFLPKEEYLALLAEQDMGMVFLDSKFTIPNFPSRILDYLDYGLPVFACTDTVSDVKQEICDTGCGLWCKSGDIEMFNNCLRTLLEDKSILISMRSKTRELLIDKYNSEAEAKKICDRIKNIKE